MFQRLMGIIFLLISFQIHATSVQDEFLYESFQSSFYSSPEGKSLVPSNESLYVDALWDSLHDGIDSQNLSVLRNIQTWQFPLAERLRLGILKLKFKEAASLDDVLIRELENVLLAFSAELKIIYILAAHEKLLQLAGHGRLIELAKTYTAYQDIADVGEGESDTEADIVSDLYFNSPDVTTYMGGEYLKSVKIFMFCQYNRLYPCLMVMNDINGIPVRNSDGSLWINKALASAVTGLPSYERNGNTPAGIFTIDSVMPDADQQNSYGQFRRMMLNFIPKSSDEAHIKSLLPKSSWDSDWWKPTTVARDIGRNLFRIHGTGRKDNVAGTPYFPFSRTHGCISQRENTYDRIQYTDQRKLLDKIMVSLELAPKYINEPKIKGLIYIIDLNDRNAPLNEKDLKDFGIQ
jgi:hypothetical protein